MIGERLAEIRKDRGMKQRELAEMLNVSETTISGYERTKNSPDDETKVRIARIFNISLDYLLGAIDDELSLDRANTITLPIKPTAKVKENLLEYAEFISSKARKKGS